MISEEDRKKLKEKFSTMPKDVVLRIFRTENCEICNDVNRLMEELSSISEGRIKLEYLDKIPEEYREVGNGPIILIDDGEIVYLGSPIGHEAWAFVETLVLKSQEDSKLEDAFKSRLKNLKSNVLLETIVTPSCPYCPYSVLMANQLAIESKGVVILSPTASSPKITYAGDYIFRNTYSDAIEGAKTAEFASKELKYGKAGILFINNDYGVGLKDAFKRKFEELGGKIVIDEGYDPKTTDFRTILVKVKERSPEVIYIAGYSEMGQLLRQMRETGIKIPVLSCIMFEISDIAKVAGKAAEGVIYAYPSYDPEKGNEITLKFAKKFKEKYGTLPDPEAAFSYDAVKILALAMEKGGFTSEDIKNALYKIKGYNGITGKTSFDENGDVIKPVGFKRVHNGKYEWLKLEY